MTDDELREHITELRRHRQTASTLKATVKANKRVSPSKSKIDVSDLL